MCTRARRESCESWWENMYVPAAIALAIESNPGAS